MWLYSDYTVLNVLPLLLWYCVSTQAELLTGSSVGNVEEAHRAGQELLKRGCGSLIITLGPLGCVVLEAPQSISKHVPTPAVTAVDTTVSLIHLCILCLYFHKMDKTSQSPRSCLLRVCNHQHPKAKTTVSYGQKLMFPRG